MNCKLVFTNAFFSYIVLNFTSSFLLESVPSMIFVVYTAFLVDDITLDLGRHITFVGCTILYYIATQLL